MEGEGKRKKDRDREPGRGGGGGAGEAGSSRGVVTPFGPHFLWPPIRLSCLFIGPNSYGEPLAILSPHISRPLSPDALTVVSSMILVQGVHLLALRDGMEREGRGYGWSMHSTAPAMGC